MRYGGSLIVAICFFATGCDVDKPLSDPATAEIDEQLLGHWAGVLESDDGSQSKIHLFIGKHSTKGNPESIMEALGVEYNIKEMRVESGTNKVQKMYFSVTTIGKLKLLNVYHNALSEKGGLDLSEKGSFDKWAENMGRSCSILKYETDGKQLRLIPLDNKKLEQLTKDGILEKKNDRIRASSLIAYLRKSDGKGMFSNSGIRLRSALTKVE